MTCTSNFPSPDLITGIPGIHAVDNYTSPQSHNLRRLIDVMAKDSRCEEAEIDERTCVVNGRSLKDQDGAAAP